MPGGAIRGAGGADRALQQRRRARRGRDCRPQDRQRAHRPVPQRRDRQGPVPARRFRLPDRPRRALADRMAARVREHRDLDRGLPPRAPAPPPPPPPAAAGARAGPRPNATCSKPFRRCGNPMRLLPVTIVAIGALLGLRAADLWFQVTPPRPRRRNPRPPAPSPHPSRRRRQARGPGGQRGQAGRGAQAGR